MVWSSDLGTDGAAWHSILARRCRSLPFSFFFRRKLRQQVRPVPSDNTAYFIIDDSYDLEAFLDLSANQLEFLRTERMAVQKFHWHASPTRKLRTRSTQHSRLLGPERAR